jgi:hypothetical protein
MPDNAFTEQANINGEMKMNVTKVKSFSLKTVDFHTGKSISPCKTEWINCDCCGKLIVQGVVLSNGHKIGNDCNDFRSAYQSAKQYSEEAVTKLLNMFKPKSAVVSYMELITN